MSNELLLSDEENRYVIFPIRHDEIWKMYKQAEANFWTTEELDLTKDMKDYQSLTDKEKYFVNTWSISSIKMLSYFKLCSDN